MSLLMAASLLMASAAAPSSACTLIEGFDEVLAQGDARYLVFGEIHGTSESPAIFVDAVCAALEDGPVVVALEQPNIAQSDIDAFMASDGGPDAQQAFLQSIIWTQEMKDGRSSEAMFAKFDALRAMRVAGAQLGVVSFQRADYSIWPEREDHERNMAAIIEGAAKQDARVLVLVGNLHAQLIEIPYMGGYKSLAMFLPQDETLSFNILPNGGESWSCTGQPIACGPEPMRTSPKPQPRGIVMTPDEGERFSGILYLGVETTASPPKTE